MTKILTIPLRPHVKDFLLKTLGPEPLRINQTSDIGKLMRLVVHQEPFRQVRPRIVQQPEKYTLKIQLPQDLKHYTVSEQKLKDLGDYLEKYMQTAFIHYMIGQVIAGQSDWSAVRRFYEQYEINPDHYDMDTLRKVWRDYKDRIAKQNEKNDFTLFQAVA